MFRRQAFTGFLDKLLKDSAEYAKELGDRLKDRVFAEIIPQFAKGLIADMRVKGINDRDDAALAMVFSGTMTFLMPTYNGGLLSQETDSCQFLATYAIPDRYLALGFDRLTRDVDDRTQALVFLDFKSLEVRHLGSIYEGLLEFKLRIAGEKLAVTKEKGKEVLDSCDLGQSNSIKPVVSPASWPSGRRRPGPPLRRWPSGHGRTPTAAAATRARGADRHPPWRGCGGWCDSVRPADPSGATAQRPRTPATQVFHGRRHAAGGTRGRPTAPCGPDRRCPSATVAHPGHGSCRRSRPRDGRPTRPRVPSAARGHNS